MIGSNLVSEIIPAYGGNYTVGRGGKRIEKITVHHMAARWSARRCGEDFQQKGRNGSTHYGIGYDGEIAQYVSEENTAWGDSDWDSNCRSVSVECANESVGDPWRISEATLESLIRLIADVALRNDFGYLVKGQNLTWHRMYTATQCPGEYLLSQMDRICNGVNEILAKSKQPILPVWEYRVYTKENGWLPAVSGFDERDWKNGYGGNLGESIRNLKAQLKEGTLYYRVHEKGGGWLPEVKNGECASVNGEKELDGVMFRSPEWSVSYRVHTQKSGWLPSVSGYDSGDPIQGFGGNFGESIDGVMLRIHPRLKEDSEDKQAHSFFSEEEKKRLVFLLEELLKCFRTQA